MRNIALLCVVTLFLLEIGSCAYLKGTEGVGYADLDDIKQAYVGIEIPRLKNPGDLRFWNNQRFQLNPYFGYTIEPNTGGANGSGFRQGGTRREFPYVAEPDEFVIGVFGGSVAQNIFQYLEANTPEIEAVLLPALAAKGYATVTVLNFSLGGFKQPQSTFSLLYYMDTVDAALFVEGFNEIHQLRENLGSGLPADFPRSTLWRVLADAHFSPEALTLIGTLGLNRNLQLAITKVARLPILRSSMFVHLAWKAQTGVLAFAAERLRRALAAEEAETPSYGEVEAGESGETGYFEKYAAYVRMAAGAAAAARVPIVFGLQPNQYLPGTKPLSAEERREFLSDTSLEELVPTYYPRLIETYRRLASEGLSALDLTRVLADVRETAYIDTCCHLNELGASRVAAPLLAELSRSEWIGVIPDAADRPHRRVEAGAAAKRERAPKPWRGRGSRPTPEPDAEVD